MHFLRTIFWVLLAVVVALFTVRNWTPVTLSLWGDIQADTKVPLLLLVGFLIGWLPTWLLMWIRIERVSKRRIDAHERNLAAPVVPPPTLADDEEPVDVSPIFVAIDTPDCTAPRRSRSTFAASPAA